jgi:hypothetical protein
VRNGKCRSGAYKDIRAFQVEIRDGEVYVNLDCPPVNEACLDDARDVNS